MKNPIFSESAGRRAPAGGHAGIANLRSGRSRAAWGLVAACMLLGLSVASRANTVTYEQNANGQAESVVVNSSTLNYNYPK